MSLCGLLMKPPAGPKRTTFVQMLLHHYVWWGRLENYDKFEGIWTSTCLSFKSKLTMIFVFFYDFPMGHMSLMISQCYPVGFGYILYWMVHNDDDFCPSIFPIGVSGFIFQCAIQDGILSIGIPYWLEGSVWFVGCLIANCEGQTMYIRYMCVSSGAPCVQPHPIIQKSKPISHN